ncbi:Erythromycin esterase [Methylobacterium sp. 4-46]|uniref:erythromycin esterase family protein n=1 Tax=unclassified Methylobacterium TaxID=2615210 RepID=UPI000152D294|nr:MULTISPECIES: erythromycin esterase family protein [Methylobacterium]ACA17294.1 Erythromycin esterase [Methylobacterium sp. 4-46]WFT82981.1 erythromycin esterase family protein [Methylobacterium nodulans]
MGPRVFHDRTDAGRVLAGRLATYEGRPDVVVLALPRGGVPVAAEVARALRVPFDVFVVRKLGVPGNEELAMGAIASGGVRVLNADVVASLKIPPYAIDAACAREAEELRRRERAYRGGRPVVALRGLTVILVDDGLATGATMQAAIEAVRQLHPARIVVAVPTGSRDTVVRLEREADAVVCADMPEPFWAVGAAYEDFSQTRDDEVRRLLGRSAEVQPVAGAPEPDPALVETLRAAAIPLTGGAHDYDALLDLVGATTFALLGEATHGTHEFYRERAEITKRLIREKGFTAVAIEADWPDAWRVNRYVRADSEDLDAVEALAGFRRFPTWMWRNTEMVAFVEWLRAHNLALPPGAQKVGLYGIDLYSLRASMKAVLGFLETVDPAAAAQARARYACFDRFGPDGQAYGLITGLKLAPSCQDQAVAQLAALQRRAADSLAWAGSPDPEELFSAGQNARVVRNAEEYYRTIFLREVSSWNLRDSHMAECVAALVSHLGRDRSAPKIAIWAHNSHLGDARATEMSARGELNLGQILRERHGAEVVRVGFTTYAGSVTAASDWGAPVERKRVRPALPDSYEALFHALGLGRFCLPLAPGSPAARALGPARSERAIGVVYRPDTERQSHYVRAHLPDQFDVVLHFDETRAVTPLETTPLWEDGEVPETFPAGL